MEKQTRRSMLKGAAIAAGAAGMATAKGFGEKPPKAEKKAYGYGANNTVSGCEIVCAPERTSVAA